MEKNQTEQHFGQNRNNENTFLSQIKEDWGSPEIFGPWTPADSAKTEGKLPYYRSYYLITRGIEVPEVDSLPGGEITLEEYEEYFKWKTQQRNFK